MNIIDKSLRKKILVRIKKYLYHRSSPIGTEIIMLNWYGHTISISEYPPEEYKINGRYVGYPETWKRLGILLYKISNRDNDLMILSLGSKDYFMMIHN